MLETGAVWWNARSRLPPPSPQYSNSSERSRYQVDGLRPPERTRSMARGAKGPGPAPRPGPPRAPRLKGVGYDRPPSGGAGLRTGNRLVVPGPEPLLQPAHGLVH